MTTQPASQDAAMTNAMLALHRVYAGLPSSEIYEEQDCFAYRSAIDFPVFNGIHFQNFDPATADQRIEDMRRMFATQPYSWTVLPGAQPHDLAERLVRSGSTHVVELQGMIMDLSDLATSPHPPPNIDIVPTQNAAQVADYARVFPELFHEPTEGWIDQVIAAELTIFNSGQDPLHRWVAYEKGKAIAAAMTMTLEDTAVLQTLSTLELARNRGIGQALATRALQAERERGCKRAIVWSSPGAQSLYKRMGFKPCATAQVFVDKETLERPEAR